MKRSIRPSAGPRSFSYATQRLPPEPERKEGDHDDGWQRAIMSRGDLRFSNLDPARAWEDPPWVLTGTSITAWIRSPLELVQPLLPPGLTVNVDAAEVATRVRFYSVHYRPAHVGGTDALDEGG